MLSLWARGLACRSLRLSLIVLLLAGRSQQTFLPFDIPLTTRSTYVNSWAGRNSVTGPQGQGGGSHIRDGHGFSQDWTGLVRIDNVTYTWAGVLSSPSGGPNFTFPNPNSVSITPTQSIYTMTAGPMNLNITFLTTLELNNSTKQSIPFSYVSFQASSNDGQEHDVAVYTDIGTEWCSTFHGDFVQWSTNATGANIFHQIEIQQPSGAGVFVDIAGIAGWGETYYATTGNDDPRITHQIATASVLRPGFALARKLNGTQDTNFRAITTGPVFAFAKDYGTITSTPDPFVLAIGRSRTPMVKVLDQSGATLETRYPPHLCNVSSITQVIDDFLTDYPEALRRAQRLDESIMTASSSVLPGSAEDYFNILSLGVRFGYGAMEITIGLDANGKCNTSDVIAFLIDDNEFHATNGAQLNRRVSPVESLYAAFPMFMFIDPSLGAPLLEPFMRLQVSSSNPFAAHDLGSNYPTVSVFFDASQAVEHTSSMLIVNYAYARASGDISLIRRYYGLLKKWADYLVATGLDLGNQTSADNSGATGQPNLAIKSIIAIKAMGFISSAAGSASDSARYTASTLYNRWADVGTANDVMLASFDSNESWSIGYNLFFDRWLGTGVVPNLDQISEQSVQAALNSGSGNFGMFTDSTSLQDQTIISSWNMFAIGAVSSNSSILQSNIVSKMVSRAALNAGSGAFPLVYNGNNGTFISGAASPAQGATFSLLAPRIPVRGQFQLSPGSNARVHSRTGAVVGGIIGGLAGFTILVILAFLCIRARRRRHSYEWHPNRMGLPCFSKSDFNRDRENRETLFGESIHNRSDVTDPFPYIAPPNGFNGTYALTSKALLELRRDRARDSHAAHVRTPNTNPSEGVDASTSAPRSNASDAPGGRVVTGSDAMVTESSLGSGSGADTRARVPNRDSGGLFIVEEISRLRNELQAMQGLVYPPSYEEPPR